MPHPLTYRPDRFTRLAQHPDAKALWAWLQTETAITIMATACRLRRPALEALGPHVAARFPELLARHSGRQMTGHMVRQVLEAHGFRLDRANVKINPPAGPFRRGSTYVHVPQVIRST